MVPNGLATAPCLLPVPQTPSLGCTEPPASSAGMKAIRAKEAYVPLKPRSLIVLLANGQFNRLDGSDSQRKGRRTFFITKK